MNMKLLTKAKRAATDSVKQFGGTTMFLSKKKIGMFLLEKVQLLKMWTMKIFSLTNEDEYNVRYYIADKKRKKDFKKNNE